MFDSARNLWPIALMMTHDSAVKAVALSYQAHLCLSFSGDAVENRRRHTREELAAAGAIPKGNLPRPRRLGNAHPVLESVTHLSPCPLRIRFAATTSTTNGGEMIWYCKPLPAEGPSYEP